ncbi:uncharacterized protein LOC132752899 [Ruditapes philippinarum]|uniref:uncharacterized protein LOC132752899 n=1 Tax=Ruditapes philippinarum TaxID=129788 RepID=UPI00295B4AE0|nr:uncharacterized protein LOC132752899 [Ruditapes philippinarum]
MGPFLNRIRCLNLLLAVIYSGISCLKEDSPHCDATTMVGSELIRTKMNVHNANVTSFEEPFQDYMPLDICLSNGSLRIHWTTNATKEHEAKLCYEVKQLRNMDTVAIKCYQILVQQSYYKAELFCWFGTEHPKKSLYTHAIVTHQLNKQKNYYYSEFYLSSTGKKFDFICIIFAQLSDPSNKKNCWFLLLS